MQEFSNESKTIGLSLEEISINEQMLYLSEIDENGKFMFDIPLKYAINTTMKYCDGSIDLYISPSDTLTINCKISKVGNLIDINASSYDENQTQFQKEFQKYDRWITKEIFKFDETFVKDKPYDELKEICFNFEKSLHENINVKIKNGLSNQIIISYLRYSATYYSYYRILRVGKTIENLDKRALYFSFLTDSIVFNNEAFTTSWYRLFLNNYTFFFEPSSAPIIHESSWTTTDQIKKGVVTKHIDNIWGLRKYIWRDFLIASNINGMVVKKEQDISAASIDFYIQFVKEKITDEYTQQFLISLLNQTRVSILERDNLEQPNAKIRNSVMESGDSLFHEILTKNKGKVIYIDFWFTGCSGCIAEFPHVEKMHSNFSDKDVAFVFLCWKSEQTSYENVIKKYQLEGQHILLNKKQYEYFEKQFQISGFPTYVLIDKEGKVYSKHASRPSYERTIKVINDLISE